jgi:hypothetical protein
VWDPLANIIKLFKEHFGVPSVEKVRKLQTLRKGEKETCRMLKSRVERLAEETGLLNGREQAMAFVKALPAELRQRVELVLWAQSPSGVYSLDAAFQVAEQIELARAHAAGMQGWTESGGSSERRVPAMQAVDETEGPCYKCGEAGHRAAACRQNVGRCTACNKKGHKETVCWRAHPKLKPDWMTSSSGGKSQSLNQKVDKLAEQLEQLARQVAVLAGRPVRSARQAELHPHEECEDDGPVNARGASLAGWKDRWQVVDDDAPPERGGRPFLGGIAALAKKEEGERYKRDWPGSSTWPNWGGVVQQGAPGG